MSNTTPRRIPGTARQSLKSVDGTALERKYVYLPASVWEALEASARTSGRSISQLIATFATNGPDNSKEHNDQAAAIGNK
jgi:hypothetical protein